MIDPSGGFPLFYGLAGGDFVFVDLRIVGRGSKESGNVEAGIPRGWQLSVIIGDCGAESSRVEGPKVGATKTALSYHLFR